MPDMGLEAAGGISAGYKALNDIIAERKRDEILRQKMEEARQQQELQVAQFHETQRRNQEQEARLSKQDEYLGTLRTQQAGKYEQDVKESQAKQAARDRVRAQIAATPDSILSPRDKMLYIAQIDMGGDLPGQAFAAPKRSDEEEIAYQAKLAGAEAAARYPYQDHQGDKAPADYFTPVPYTGSPTGLAGFSARHNRIELPTLPEGAGSGLAGPAAKEALSKVKQIDDTLVNLDTVEAIGNKHGWKGTGMMAGVRGMLSGAGLVPDPEGDAVRGATNFIKTLIAHPLFGSAFTDTEKRLMDSFATDMSLVGTANLTRIQTMREILQKARERRLQGLDVSGPNAGKQSAGGGGVATPTPGAKPDPFGMLDNPLFK